MGRSGRQLPSDRAAARMGRLTRHNAPGASVSQAHAVEVWEKARREVAGRAATLEVLTREAGPRALDGQLDLVMVSVLGAHLSDCADCWRRWVDGYRPGDLLTRAVRARPAGAILRAAELEMRARRRRGER